MLVILVCHLISYPKGGTKSNVDTGTTRVGQQHDGMHSTPSYARFIHEVSSQRKVNFHNLETKQTELDDVLIPMSLVLEVHARVMGDKNGFFFIQFFHATGVEGVLEHGP
ncbi:hypothetical protein Tco_0701671 [Tanacetum coccineum]